MIDVEALAARLRESFSPADRTDLIAALLRSTADEATEPAPAPPTGPMATGPMAAPEPERVTAANFVLQAGPPLTPEAPAEAGDTPAERARLLAILAVNPSGVPGYVLLDQYRIPPATIELARRHGQAGRAERGVGLTHAYGGAWAADTENVDPEAIRRYQEMFAARLAELPA